MLCLEIQSILEELPGYGNEMKKKLGVFGGTFDPIHYGHMAVVQEVKKQLELEEILFVPAGVPWMKLGREISAAHHRLAMLRLAVKNNPEFIVCEVELNREGPSYTVETLEQIKGVTGWEEEIYCILGLDALVEIPSWHKPARLVELAKLVGVSRPGYHIDMDDGSDYLDEAVIIYGPKLDISGTEIRRRVALGLTIENYVPRCVEEYIKKENLYR